MGTEINQTSQHQPAVVFDGSNYHMVFISKDSSNSVLYVSSPDGLNWTLGPATGQTSSTAPALALFQRKSLTDGPPDPNLLVAVFVANDPSDRILYSILNLNDDSTTRGWRFVGQVGGESAHGVFALGSISPLAVTVYFLANDNTGRLLENRFTP
jgi:hypothetical protein